MASDQTSRIETARGPDWDLPELTDVQINVARYEARSTRNFANPMATVNDAIEILVSLASPLPVRALAPVLWVGGERLTESEALDKEGMQLRFWSFDRAKLQPGAPLEMSWIDEEPPKTRALAKFTYQPPGQKSTGSD